MHESTPEAGVPGPVMSVSPDYPEAFDPGPDDNPTVVRLPVPQQDQPAKPKRRSNLFTGAWLVDQEFPEITWQVPGIIPEGVGMVVGPPKIGKSWIVLAIALAVATGGRALGCIPVQQRPVLYMALEDGPRRLKTRLGILLEGDLSVDMSELHMDTDAAPAEIFDVIDEWLSEHGHRSPLIILDTLGKVMPPARMGETQYNRDYRVGDRLKAVTNAYPGSSLLVVHHNRKAGAEDFVDTASGTQGLTGSMDTIIVLSRSRHEAEGLINMTTREGDEGEFALTFDGGFWSLDGGSLEASREMARGRREEITATNGLGDRSSQIVSWVLAHPAGVTARQVDDHFGTSDARTYLDRAYKAGRIDRVSRGKYGPQHQEPLSTPVATVANPRAPDVANTPNASLATHATHPLISGDADCEVCQRNGIACYRHTPNRAS